MSDFQIAHFMAKGSTCEVKLAEDKRNGEFVVLKVIKPDYLNAEMPKSSIKRAIALN